MQVSKNKDVAGDKGRKEEKSHPWLAGRYRSFATESVHIMSTFGARKKEKRHLEFEKVTLKENSLAVWRKGRQKETPEVSIKWLGILK